MAETKFTPGPWGAVRQRIGWCVRDLNGDGGYSLFSSFVQPLGIQVFGKDWDHGRRHSGPESNYICANAHLIAAAPDLYEMLVKARETCCCGSTVEDIDRVLAKARGES